MAALTFARLLSSDDQETLESLDASYARQFGLEPIISRSSVSFYGRTGHAFVAVRNARTVGFVLAQAVWNGTRPTIYVNRLNVPNDDNEAREALLEAVTKSAYDAAVYDLQVQVPETDAGAAQALAVKNYALRPERVYGRVLGSRGQVRKGQTGP